VVGLSLEVINTSGTINIDSKLSALALVINKEAKERVKNFFKTPPSL
jgi:hypothetical protein